jgi:hypothetical protein
LPTIDAWIGGAAPAVAATESSCQVPERAKWLVASFDGSA